MRVFVCVFIRAFVHVCVCVCASLAFITTRDSRDPLSISIGPTLGHSNKQCPQCEVGVLSQMLPSHHDDIIMRLLLDIVMLSCMFEVHFGCSVQKMFS